MRSYKVLLLAWFGLLFVVPALLALLGVRQENIENRAAVEAPEFSISSILDTGYYAKLASFLGDRLPIRPSLIQADAYIDLFLFGDSPVDTVVRGRDGWFFYGQTIDRNCHGDFAGFRAAVTAMEQLSDILAEQGIHFLLAIAPDKKSVYPEQLRDADRRATSCTVSTRERMREILLSSEVDYIDMFSVFSELREAGKHPPIYSRLDTHWTTFGSANFAEKIVSHTQPRHLLDAELKALGASDDGGDLSRMMGFNQPDDRLRHAWFRPGVDLIRNETLQHGGEGRDYRYRTSVTTGAELDKRRLLVVHDSFIYQTWDHLDVYFEDTLYVHITAIENDHLTDLIIGSDIVLFETVERESFERIERYFTQHLVDEIDSKLVNQRPSRAKLVSGFTKK